MVLKVHNGYKNARTFFTSDNAANYDSIVRFTTFGQDYIWKNQIVKMIGKRCLVLDLACGTGILSSMFIDDTDVTRVIGIDLEFNYLKVAKNKRKNLLLINGNMMAPCYSMILLILNISYSKVSGICIL